MARKNRFSVGEAISFGWESFKKNPMVIVYVLIPMIVPPVLNQILTVLVGDKPHLIVMVLLVLINIAVSLTLSIGLIKVLLALYARKKVDISDFYTGYTLVIPYFFASLLSTLAILGVLLVATLVGGAAYFALNALVHDTAMTQGAIAVGVAVLVIVVIFVGVRLGMWKYLLIDKKMGIVESIRESWKITKGSEVKLVLFALASLGVMIIGLLALVLGIFVALPVVQLANVYIYKKLSPGK